MTDFDGARALVTGGGSGIGAAIARRLASDGAEVWVMGRRREALLDVSDNVIVGDVSVRDDCNRAIAECGPLDILINNAGVGDADWERTLAINLTGAHWLAELATDGLCARRGAVVNVASMGAIRAHSRNSQYGVSKAGLLQLTRSLAVRLGPHGVRVNSVCPGWIRTPMADESMLMFDPDPELGYQRATRYTPLRRPGTGDEVAAAVAFLASSEASYITGAMLTIDGGASVVDVAMLPGD